MSTTDTIADKLGESLRLAVEIADEAAMADIQSNSAAHGEGGHVWWFTQPPCNDKETLRVVERALKYLALRKHLVVHETQPLMVRFTS